eukprot:Colp12_sorted_trinity150504_noHs@7106
MRNHPTGRRPVQKEDSLRKLRLTGNNLSDQQGVMLAEALTGHPLARLQLAMNQLAQAAAMALAEALAHVACRLECLELSNNMINGAGVAALLGAASGEHSWRFGPVESIGVMTSFADLCCPTLTLQHALDLAAAIRPTPYSLKEWDAIIGRRGPIWLKTESLRKRGVFVCNLAPTVDGRKLEGLLENEADCSVKDVFIVKDPVMSLPNGSAWVQFSDDQSVGRCVAWAASGRAVCYGRPLCVSPLNVEVAGDKGAAERAALRELARREREKVQESSATTAAVAAAARSSRDRHIQMMLKPAYADGRVW